MLSQIGKCCNYADRFKRKVIVETDFTHATYFKDDFSRYFISHDPALVLSSAEFKHKFDALTVEPKSFSGRVTTYQVDGSALLSNANISTGLVPKFNLKQDYQAQLLLHHSLGGGIKMQLLALRRMSVTPLVMKCIAERRAKIGDAFTGIHIRNTDYRTDYQNHLRSLVGKISGPIFLATDSVEVLAFGREIFSGHKVYNFSSLPTDGQPLHTNRTTNIEDANLDAIADLFLLTLASKFYFFPIVPNGSTTVYSGFSKLADHLQRNPGLRDKLLYQAHRGWIDDFRLRFKKMRGRAKFYQKRLFSPVKSRPKP